MFSGIVKDLGTVRAAESRSRGRRLHIEAPPVAARLAAGDSVAVQGVCLTAVESRSGRFAADVSPETLRRTTLGDLRPGQRVHLELPLGLADPLGGHLVTGHVDGTGRVQALGREGEGAVLAVQAPPEVTPYLVPKGSVAVDGVSLTVAGLQGDAFEVFLIPHTLAVTLLGGLRPGQRVNLEGDVLGKYVERFVAAALATAGRGAGPAARL